MEIEVKNYVTGEVEERLYASVNIIGANTTTPSKVCSGRVPSGYDAVIVSIACTRDSNIGFNIKINDKYYYDNTLNAGSLAGLDYETLLAVPLKENDIWELGFTNTSGSNIAVNWRLRVRLFRKK
jgi:hypothetical protein